MSARRFNDAALRFMDISTIITLGSVRPAFNFSAIHASKTVSKFRLSRFNP